MHQEVINKRLRVRILGVSCSETKILTRLFHLISHVDPWFRELIFRNALGPDNLITVHKFETEGRLVRREESEISCRLSGLANYVESHRSLRVESLEKRAASREGPEASGVTTRCNISRGKSNTALLCKELNDMSAKSSGDRSPGLLLSIFWSGAEDLGFHLLHLSETTVQKVTPLCNFDAVSGTKLVALNVARLIQLVSPLK